MGISEVGGMPNPENDTPSTPSYPDTGATMARLQGPIPTDPAETAAKIRRSQLESLTNPRGATTPHEYPSEAGTDVPPTEFAEPAESTAGSPPDRESGDGRQEAGKPPELQDRPEQLTADETTTSDPPKTTEVRQVVEEPEAAEVDQSLEPSGEVNEPADVDQAPKVAGDVDDEPRDSVAEGTERVEPTVEDAELPGVLDELSEELDTSVIEAEEGLGIGEPLADTEAGEAPDAEAVDTSVIEAEEGLGIGEPLADTEAGEAPDAEASAEYGSRKAPTSEAPAEPAADASADSAEQPFTQPRHGDRSRHAKPDAPLFTAPEYADDPRDARFKSETPPRTGSSNPWRRVTLPPRYSLDPTKLSPLAEAVWAPTPNMDFRGIDDWIQAWKAAGNERERDAAAREFWTRVATVVARKITDENDRLAIRQGLYEFIADWYTGHVPSNREEKERRTLAVSFLNLLRQQGIEVLKELAMQALIELILPGAHFVLPPTGFVSAIFSACDLLAIFPPA